MDRQTRSEMVTKLKLLVTAIRAQLDECADRMWEAQEEFQYDRRQLLSAVRRQSGRGQASNLLLCVRVRSDRPLAAPSADWKRIQARGHRVQHAKTTLASKRFRQLRPASYSKSVANIFSNTVVKNRKFGWREMDILRHAHPCEFELVKATEAKLRPLRKRVAELTSTGTRALQALYQHQRMTNIEAETDSGGVPSALARRNASKKPQTDARSMLNDTPPQLRFPNRRPAQALPISRPYTAAPADATLNPNAPPQFRRPV